MVAAPVSASLLDGMRGLGIRDGTEAAEPAATVVAHEPIRASAALEGNS